MKLHHVAAPDISWNEAKAGDIFRIKDDISLYTFDGTAAALHFGEIVLCLGHVDIDGEMLYVTCSGIGGLPSDYTFYTHESTKMY